MSLIKELEEWKEDLEELATEKAKAEGRLEQSMTDLKKLGYNSLEDAETAYKELLAKKQKAEEEAQEMISKFKEKYKEFISQ